TIVLTTAGVIRGRAEDGETQQPITAGSVGWRVPRGYRAEKRDFRSDDGTFEVTGVTPGKVEVTASAPGYLDGKVTGVEVSEGEVKEGVVVSLKKGRAISGRVLDPERGGGVPNATVSWRRPSDRMGDSFAVGPNGAFAMFPNSATTDAEGRFEYDAVPPEKLIFKASHPDFLDAEVPLDASSESAVEITLSQGGSIKGIVRNRDGSSPVAGAEVTLQVSGATPMAISGDESQSDENGDFSFRHLKEGRYLLTARSSSGRSAKTDVVLNSGQNAEGVVLQMSSGTTLRGTVTGLPVERLAGLEIGAYSDTFSGRTSTDPTGAFIVSDVPPGVVVVSAATARWGAGTRSVSKNVDVPEGAAEVPVEIVFSGTSRLEVRVTRKDQPLAGIGLNVRPDPATTPGSQVLGETDADGRAVLEGLEDGAYILSGSSFGGGGGSFLRQITVSGDTSVDVALGRASISGTVTDASSGEPLADASVSAENGQEAYQYQMPSARTDSQGNYSLDNLDPGEFQVTARRDGYKQKTLAVTAGESPTQLSFKLSRGGGLTVVASDGLTGLPLSGLSALAFSDSGTVAFSGAVSLDAGGTGEIQSLGPGTYSLYVASAGYSVRSLSDVRVPSAPLALSLTPGGRLEARAGSPASGRIVDSNGQPYLLSLWSLDGRIAISPPLSAWDHMAPGSYNLVIDGPEGRKSFPFAMKEGETTRLELP
ncbi:MAG TPA: carboxypeptidase regulatory-like domain-containing protein, partial [Thermoanaerobaculia bacterium]|nr:carboxypeptidase regulatory-like domain-containing protein [Thermoanaerobaculia bacterium]